MSGNLFVQTDGVRSYSAIHGEVASGLSQLLSASSDATGVQLSHGTIAAAVSNALSGVLAARQGTLQATATSGTTISELLDKAAQMYEQGDIRGAEKLRAAAEVMGEGTSSATPGGGASGVGAAGSPTAGAPTGAASGAASGGGGVVGQLLGQVGQQLGALGQLAQPLAGLAQGLQQVPQQVMQGVQQAVQGAAGQQSGDPLAQTGTDAAAPTDESQADEQRPPERRDDANQAAPGESAAGRAPDVAPRPESAPTRPQVDESPL